ncbi:MAG: M23 family metallopeptidase [Spirochaetales bacterium]|nr:M23 family metallopeptidase [Spirochaetales bacterium]
MLVSPPDGCAAGGVLAVFVPIGDVPADSSVELHDSDGRILARNLVFPIRGRNGVESAVSVLGIPHNLTTGEYYLALTHLGELLDALRPISIQAGVFLSENISLTSNMSDLRQTEDPRRNREAAERWQIISSVNTGSIYHTTAFGTPLSNRVRTSYFGDSRTFLYADGGIAHSVHTGIDFAAPVGTPVYSAGNGRIVFSAERLITGNSIIIEHLPGIFSIYYHLDELKVFTGEFVSEGQIVGLVGATGLVTGAHLHWEFSIGGVSVDPDAMTNFALLDKEGVFEQILVH